MAGPSTLLPQLVTGNVGLTDGALTAALLNSAPASDTGQVGIAVRVISQLGASGGAGGGLTDTQLRATPVPMSLASVPSHAVTNAGTFAVQAALNAETTKVIGTVNIAAAQTIGVTGTFWQTTQPVSIAATVTVSGPLTDTQLRASAVPVSLASVPSHAVTNAGTFAVQVTSAPSTAVTNAGTFIVQPELLNRVSCNAFSEAVAGIIAETAITMSKSLANATVSTATSSGPTSGKNWRITSLLISWVSTSTTANTARLRIRVNASGAATTSSPIQFSARIAWESPTFIANEGEFQQIPIPDGLDIPNGGQAMFTIACVAANGTLDVLALGYEYTP